MSSANLIGFEESLVNMRDLKTGAVQGLAELYEDLCGGAVVVRTSVCWVSVRGARRESCRQAAG